MPISLRCAFSFSSLLGNFWQAEYKYKGLHVHGPTNCSQDHYRSVHNYYHSHPYHIAEYRELKAVFDKVVLAGQSR